MEVRVNKPGTTLKHYLSMYLKGSDYTETKQNVKTMPLIIIASGVENQ